MCFLRPQIPKEKGGGLETQTCISGSRFIDLPWDEEAGAWGAVRSGELPEPRPPQAPGHCLWVAKNEFRSSRPSSGLCVLCVLLSLWLLWASLSGLSQLTLRGLCREGTGDLWTWRDPEERRLREDEKSTREEVAFAGGRNLGMEQRDGQEVWARGTCHPLCLPTKPSGTKLHCASVLSVCTWRVCTCACVRERQCH